MEFKKVFRGYDPKQVDKYIAETADKEAVIRHAQRERIDELSDENYSLRHQLNYLQQKRDAISDALVVSQTLAKETERDAEQYADKALFQAKKFYATWQAYSQTIVASFTDDELKAFNELERKIENVISSYEKQRVNAAEEGKPAKGKSEKKSDAKPQENPISKVEAAAGYVIDLRELTHTDQSLEELCADLGLINMDGKKS